MKYTTLYITSEFEKKRSANAIVVLFNPKMAFKLIRRHHIPATIPVKNQKYPVR